MNIEELKNMDKEELLGIIIAQRFEIKRLDNIINKAIEYINENWGHWCSNHCKYATETINILKGGEKDERQ